MSHTPGPWQNDSLKFTGGWRCIVNLPGGRSIDVADLRNRKTDDEDASNACLIAAAPDLLAACKALMAEMLVLNPYDRRDVRFPAKAEVLARKAIEKAGA